ncbi:hypothetical protein Tco_1539418 [Tanacetum coccineum]
MPANEERSISLGQLQERPMKEPTSDTEGRYGDGAARTKVRRPKPKALLYHVCSNRIELLFQNGEHKVALVRSAIKQVAKRSAIGEEKGIEFAVEMMTSGLAKGRNASRQSSSATALPQNILNGLCQHGGRSSLPSYYSSTRGLPRCHLERRDQEEEKEKAVFCRFLTSLEKKLSCRHQGKGPRLYTAAEAESKGLVERSPGLWATATWVEKRPLNIIWTDRGYNMGLGLLMAAFASLYGLRAKALDPPLNPPTVRLSVLLSLKTTEEFQFPKQPSPKQQLEPIQLMKEDLPSRKGLKAS